jgi:hypothetical protein
MFLKICAFIFIVTEMYKLYKLDFFFSLYDNPNWVAEEHDRRKAGLPADRMLEYVAISQILYFVYAVILLTTKYILIGAYFVGMCLLIPRIKKKYPMVFRFLIPIDIVISILLLMKIVIW